MTPMNPDPGAVRPASEVWPPPPVNSPAAVESPLAAMGNFQVQSPWLVLLLSVVTLGVYTVFWLRKNIVILNRLRPDLKVSPGTATFALVFSVFSLILDVASWVSRSQSIDSFSNILDRLYGLLVLILSFQMRNAFNTMLQAQKGGPLWFSGLWTWLLSAIYLQHQINKDIYVAQSQPPSVSGY